MTGNSLFAQFWIVLAFVGVPGVMGGLVYAVSVFLKATDVPREEWRPTGNLTSLYFFCAQGLTGFGGAVAALLVMLWANRVPQPLDLDKMLTLACTGFVSGYVANRLLPAVAESLYSQFKKLAQQNEELFKRTEENGAKIRDAVNLSTALTRAKDYLSGGSFVVEQTSKLLEELSSLAEIYPTNRTLNILLARTWYRAAGAFDQGVSSLQRYIKAKENAKEVDVDMAAAYWNLASYFEEKFEAVGESWRDKAVDAMRRALQIAPSFASELRTDKDFRGLLASEGGRKLLSELPGSGAEPQSGSTAEPHGKPAG